MPAPVTEDEIFHGHFFRLLNATFPHPDHRFESM
jgi:hypothetical protein